MKLSDIKREVEALPAEEKKQLTAWLVARHPVLRVQELVEQASAMVDEDQWVPELPTGENIPKGKLLDHAMRMADRLGHSK